MVVEVPPEVVRSWNDVGFVVVEVLGVCCDTELSLFRFEVPVKGSF